MKNFFAATKKRFLSLVLAVMTVLTMVPVTPAMAASPEDTATSYAATSTKWGGLRLAWDGPLTVYADANFQTKKGTIYQYEGYTVLNVISGGFEVQYSNSKGAQHGYTKKGRNPQTKEEIKIPASKSPVFKAGKALKDVVNK